MIFRLILTGYLKELGYIFRIGESYMAGMVQCEALKIKNKHESIFLGLEGLRRFEEVNKGRHE